MKQSKMVGILVNKVRKYAYRSEVHHKLKRLGHEVAMQQYYYQLTLGKVLGCLEALAEMGSDLGDLAFESAVQQAAVDIGKADGDIETLLRMAAFDGAEVAADCERGRV